ncbi:peroxisomal targeting signal 1 receptor-like isoform X3 [Dinothrombium tinctorium]|uniref:Peroxisomal targeting signal 1 receptor-like isoform X3 n=1 Tax=Dinothrombium tinctorium TaxID=1965070 RepID=A0A3S3RNQ0_9ACAR|nr:peroxisomal targeting signal 1 receptor-like isoform X3 [Dinothrombium tinctorium]RWS02484.1 peroxisomal targeting signal 1 receptor-like isoform X3 [Dinothrombium tinctorium]RWS02508.1 peroxisomal targeting signal 1 receptor-like isoform X3 [Dinothrombium tinctorium]
MAMKRLVDGECGDNNALMRVASHFTQEKNFAKNHLKADFRSPPLEEQFVNEFLEQQSNETLKPLKDHNRFRMDSILRELNSVQNSSQILDSKVSENEIRTGEQWSQEYREQNAIEQFEDNFYSGITRFPESESQPDVKWAHEFLTESEKKLSETDLKFDFTAVPNQNWIEEFKSDESFAKEAKNFVDLVRDEPDLNETEFMKFIRKVGNVEESQSLNHRPQLGGAWAKEFQMWTEGNKEATEIEEDINFWDSLAKDWEQNQESEGIDAWIREYGAMQEDPVNEIDYNFSEENPLKDSENPFEEGLRKLQQGDIPSAVLLFEAACQKEPDNVLAWQYLGTTQAENEHDSAAIQALRKCLSLQSNNLIAIMALAVSYTNESMQNDAISCLKQWIKNNEKYSHLILNEEAAVPPFTDYESFTKSFTEVRDLYIKAARLTPNSPDADVQCCLGVLFNLSGEYAKAADCFQAALQVKPRDALLWNRLGATLANGNKPEEAVHAYSEALEISPGFIRARFNLGISCINLKAYREAAEHFLTVLNLQNAGRGPKGVQSRAAMSNNVWSSLRLVMSLLGRQDLYDYVDRKDLHFLNNEFNMEF